jgi:hypothetical protein
MKPVSIDTKILLPVRENPLTHFPSEIPYFALKNAYRHNPEGTNIQQKNAVCKRFEKLLNFSQ